MASSNNFLDTALNFVAGISSDATYQQPHQQQHAAMTSVDKDILSWLIMNGDLFSGEALLSEHSLFPAPLPGLGEEDAALSAGAGATPGARGAGLSSSPFARRGAAAEAGALSPMHVHTSAAAAAGSVAASAAAASEGLHGAGFPYLSPLAAAGAADASRARLGGPRLTPALPGRLGSFGSPSIGEEDAPSSVSAPSSLAAAGGVAPGPTFADPAHFSRKRDRDSLGSGLEGSSAAAAWLGGQGASAEPNKRSGSSSSAGGEQAMLAPAAFLPHHHLQAAGGLPRIPSSVALSVQQLELQLEHLKSENQALKSQLRALSSATSKESNAQEQQRQSQMRRIVAMVAERSDANELRRAILQYKDLHADFGKDRWVALRHHLRCLKALLLPNQVTKMCMWSIEAGETTPASSPSAAAAAHHAAAAAGGTGARAGYHSSSSSQGDDLLGSTVAGAPDATASPATSSVWAQLVQACEMTPEQQVGILGLRSTVREQRCEFAGLLTMLRELEEKMTRNFQGLELQMSLLMGFLTPRQIALFLEWMETNRPLFALVTSLASWPASAGGGAAAAAAESVGRLQC